MFLRRGGEPGVVPGKVPSTMMSKLLDYIRPGRKNLLRCPRPKLLPPPREPLVSHFPLKIALSLHRPPQRAFRARWITPLSRTGSGTARSIWERGRDGHAYASMALMFAVNGCTRIDDIARMTSAELKELAKDFDLEVTVGLVNSCGQVCTG